jgi:hypothetical protein
MASNRWAGGGGGEVDKTVAADNYVIVSHSDPPTAINNKPRDRNGF